MPNAKYSNLSVRKETLAKLRDLANSEGLSLSGAIEKLLAPATNKQPTSNICIFYAECPFKDPAYLKKHGVIHWSNDDERPATSLHKILHKFSMILKKPKSSPSSQKKL